MLGYRFHYLEPFLYLVNLPNLPKGLVNIGYGCYKRGSLFDRAAQRYPVEWVAPTIIVVAGTSSSFENFQKVKRFFIVDVFVGGLCQKGKSHRIMRIGNRKSLAFPEDAPCGRHKSLRKHHRRYRQYSQPRPFVVRSLSPLPYAARIETLEVVGSLAVVFQPLCKFQDGGLGLFDRQRSGFHFRGSLNRRCDL